MHGRVYLVFTSIALLTLHAGAQGPYYLQRALSGSSFFDAFTFDDPSTDERVSSDRLVNASSARAAGLASVADDGHVLLRVDNSTSVAYNDKRASVSVTSADAWGLGTLVVLDVRHVPVGCSVWPAFSSRSDTWPVGGGLNIFKSRNLEQTSTMTLSLDPTATSCVLDTAVLMSGTVVQENCASAAECAISHPFSNGSQAGTWVAELAATAISVWFFPRDGGLPQMLDAALDHVRSVAPLGTPAARFAFADGSGCDLGALIAPQRLVVSISLCGLFADFDATASPDALCPGSCYTSYVLGAPSGYDNAFFDIASLRIFSNITGALGLANPPWLSLGGGPDPRDVLLVLAGSVGGLLLAGGAWFAGWMLPVRVRVRTKQRHGWRESASTY